MTQGICLYRVLGMPNIEKKVCQCVIDLIFNLSCYNL